VNTKSEKYIKIFFDGGSRGNPGPSAAAFVAYDEKGKKVIEKSKFLGETTNNVAEYNGLLLALEVLERDNIKKIIICTDSKLVFSQVRGLWKVKNEKIAFLLDKIRKKLTKYEAVDLRLIPREENKEADKLVNKELDGLDSSEAIHFTQVTERDA
jgi:ribonuclease HI